jgi:hypothetical protein
MLGSIKEKLEPLNDRRVRCLTIGELAGAYLKTLEELDRIKTSSVVEACMEFPNVAQYIEQLEKENSLLKEKLNTQYDYF